MFDIDFQDPSSWDIRVNEGLLEKILLSLDRMSSRLKKETFFRWIIFSAFPSSSSSSGRT